MIPIPAKALKALIPFMSKDALRDSMMGINVEPMGDHVILTATDGHALLSLRVPRDEPGNEPAFVLPSSVVIAGLKGLTKRNVAWTTVLIGNADGKVTLSRPTGESVTQHAIDSLFPNWRAIMPSDTPEIDNSRIVTLNPEFLQHFWTAGEWLFDGEKPIVLPTSPRRMAHVLFPKHNDIEAFGVVMPILVDLDEYDQSVPSWIKVAPEEPVSETV